MVGFFVSLGELFFLCCEALALVNGVVQLRVGVCHFPAVHEEFKTLYIFGIFRFLFGQRRNLDRVIHDKGWLYQMFFYKFLKEQVQDIAFLVPLFILNMMVFCGCPCFLQCMDFMEIYAGIFLDGVYHSDSLKRLSEIHLNSLIGDRSRPQNFLRHMAVQAFGQIHHSIVVGICLIELHQCELRIVPGVQPFVAEYAPDFIDTLQTADNQSFQRQFQRNAELEIFIQRIEMRLERSCCRAACICHEHRCFYFHKSLGIQILTNTADDFRTLDKGVLYFRVHNQIYITLAIADVCVGQAVKFLWQNLQALAQKGYF